MSYFVNFPKVRIRQTKQNTYIVEIQNKFLFFRYWVHIVYFSGLDTIPFKYSSFDIALNEATRIFKNELIVGSRDNN